MAYQVSAIIPAYNEADVITDTIMAALNIPGVTQVIVVDDASTDGTADIARIAGAHQVVSLEKNLGKGGALNRVWPAAQGDIFLLLDADLGASASEGAKLLAPVLSGSADMSIAVFGQVEPVVGLGSNNDSVKLGARSGGFGLVMKTARFGIKSLTGKCVISPLAGPRALKRDIVEKSGGFASKFGVEVGLTIDALRMGSRIIEVPVGMVHRASGRDLKGFIHRGRQLMDVISTLGMKALGE